MILVNGDSWTGGKTYPSREDLWPSKLASWGLDVTNLAIGGSSNQRIFRTTIEYLYSTETTNITHLIIGWSTLDRYEFPSESGRYFRITAHGVGIFDNGDPVENIETFRTIYYNHMYSQKLQYQSFYHNLMILQDLCRYKNIKFLNFNSLWTKPELLTASGYLPNNWLLPPDHSMARYCDELGYGRMESGHTTAQGQTAWAEHVNKFL